MTWNGLIPFNRRGDQLAHTEYQDVHRWEPRFHFGASLRFVGHSKGRSHARFEIEVVSRLRGAPKGCPLGKGRKVWLSMADVSALLQAAPEVYQVSQTSGGVVISGRWGFVRRGSSYYCAPTELS